MTTTVSNDHTDWFDFNSSPTQQFHGGWAAGDGFQTVFKVWNNGSFNFLTNGTGLSGVAHSKGNTNISGTGVHMHAWINGLDRVDTEAGRGYAIRLTAGTSFTANYDSFNAGGQDTSRISVERFIPLVVNINGTPDASAGTLNLTSVQAVWVEADIQTNSGQKTNYADRVYYGTKTIFQGGTTAIAAGNSLEASTYATGSPSNIVAVGEFINIGGSYFVLDGIDIGDGTTANMYWQDNNETWVFEGFPNISKTFYTITFVGNATGTQSIIFGTKTGTGIDATGAGGNTFIAGGPEGPFNFVITDSNLDAAGLYGCIFNNQGDEDGTLNMTVGEAIGNQFNGMGQITLNTGTGNAVFTRNGVTDSVTAATGVEEAAVNLGTTKPATNAFRFVTISGASRYSLRIEGTTQNDTWDLNDIISASPGTKDILIDYPAQTGGNKLTINLNGTSSLEGDWATAVGNAVEVTGGIALADVVIQQTAQVTFSQLKDNTEVRIYAAGTNNELAGIEDATAGTTDNRTFAASLSPGTSVDYVLHNWQPGVAVYQSIRVEGFTWPSADQTIVIQQQIDRNAI